MKFLGYCAVMFFLGMTFRQVQALQQRVTSLEHLTHPLLQGPLGPPGRRGGMENGVFGTYSGPYPGVFVPDKH